jgi:CubicO group peptidase (beta-lactamase class C family)
VVDLNGIVEAGVVGVRSIRDEAAATLNDRFHIGSLTKAMTATMIARLVERGELTWETSVGDAFPEFEDEIHEDFRKVTLAQLLAHRAGLADDRADMMLVLRQRQLTGTPTEQRRELVTIVLSQKPAHEPGSAMVYSNAGYSIAGAMAEAMTGDSWETLMQRLLFEPLGMKSAGYGAPGSADELDQPRGHRVNFGRLTPIPPSELADNPVSSSPAGRVHCSVEDLARFARLHLRGAHGEAELLAADTFAMLQRDPENDGYALGWGVGSAAWADGRLLSHAGSNTMWFAVMRLAPARELGFVAVTNIGGDAGRGACLEIIDALAARHIPMEKERRTPGHESE